MKKRLLSGFLCLCMVLTLLPVPARAAVPSGVTVDGTWIFANGNAITLKAGTSVDKTLIYLDSDLSNPITLTGPEGNITDGYDLSSYRIYGGCFNTQSPAATVATTSVTMEGGKVDLIHGGGHGASASGAEPTSIVTGTASVTLKGGVTGSLYGGGRVGVMTGGTRVTINGGTVTGTVFTGHSNRGKITGNMMLTMTGGTVEGNMRIWVNDIDDPAPSTTVVISGGTVKGELTSRAEDKATLTVSGNAQIGTEGSSGTGLQYKNFQSVTIADTPTVRFKPVSGAAAGDTVASATALTNLSLCGSEADKFELELVSNAVTLKAKAQGHTHNWGKIWEKDDTGHWHECYAGDPCPITDHTQKDGYAVHANGDEYKSDNDNHWKECVCGHRMGETGHTLQYTSDEWNHRQICAVCGDFDQDRGTEKPHDWESDTDITCNTCGYVRTITPSHTHVWDTGWSKNDTHHWHQCTAQGCDIDYANMVDGQLMAQAGYAPHTKTWVNTDAAQHWQTCATCGWTGTKADHVYDNDQDAECNTCGYTRTITPPTPPDSGSTEGKVEVGEGAPPVTVGADTLNTLEELAGTPAAGETITVKLTVEKKAESDAEGAAEIKGAATGKTVEFLDLSLVKTVTGGTKPGDSPIKDTQDKVLEIVVSYDLSGKKDVTVYRYHGGTVQELIQDGTKADGSFQLGANSITIYTTKFSTYAIGYTPDNGGNQPQPPSGGGNGGGGYVPPTYAVDLPASTPGGKLSASHKSASSGATVTLTLTPEKGYEIGGVTVTDRNGKTVAVTDKGDGKYTFTMPSRKVTVKAEFTKSKGGYADCPRDNSCPIWRFPDADPAAWYHDGVHYCVENGLMSGYGGLFRPDDSLSRAEFVQVLHNLEGTPVVNYLMGFEDIPGGAWYAEAVRWAASRQIAGGYGNGRFGPNHSISREELAVMLWRYAGRPAATGKELDFADAEKASGWATEALCWAVDQGILRGKDGGILDPKGMTTRAEAAAVLQWVFRHGSSAKWR